MKENTTIGDCAPITMDQEGPKMLGEKFQSPLRAKFRSLAEKNGYPKKLAEAMVSMDQAVYRIETDTGNSLMNEKELSDLAPSDLKKIKTKTTLVQKGELLTMHAQEARDLGFACLVVKNRLDLLQFLGSNERNSNDVRATWSERLVMFLNGIAPILILLGLAGIYLEIKTPGFGMFGIAAIAIFAVLFSTKYLVGMADYIEIVLFAIGVGLIVAEIFFLPGFGFLAIIGLGVIFIAIFLSFQPFVIPQTPWDRQFFNHNIRVVGLTFLLSIPLLVLIFLTGIKLGPLARLSLQDNVHSGPMAREGTSFARLDGARGLVVSTCHPTGVAEIDGRRMNVVSAGEYIPPGTRIKVVEVLGNKITVAADS
jgi:membrane-bound serine protease (ClpP class)